MRENPEELKDKSAEWWKGYHAAENDYPMDITRSEDWIDGYMYASCHEPIRGAGPQ